MLSRGTLPLNISCGCYPYFGRFRRTALYLINLFPLFQHPTKHNFTVVTPPAGVEHHNLILIIIRIGWRVTHGGNAKFAWLANTFAIRMLSDDRLNGRTMIHLKPFTAWNFQLVRIPIGENRGPIVVESWRGRG